MSLSIFLSASVPLPPPHRHERYFGTADVIAIRDSIRALVTAVIPKGKIVFGGHPAITPMVRLLVKGMGVSIGAHIVLYQSRFFAAHFPKDNQDFESIVLVDAVAGNEDASLASMREAMIRSEDFAAGIFIGGMEGVEDEYAIFRRVHPSKPAFPIASTGAAARLLFDRFQPNNRELLDNLVYLSLYRKLLNFQSD